MNTTQFKLGELFSGPGGLGLAASGASARVEAASISHAWATDYDADTCTTYARNVLGADSIRHDHPRPTDSPTVYCADICKMDTELLPAIDALAFGAPCNDFSQVGERKGFGGDYGPLYRYGVNVLASHQPKWFLFENVGGIRGDGLNTIMSDFEALGYRLYPHYYDFSDYGVAQKRKRVIIIGIREDCDVEFAIPAPFKSDVSARTALYGISPTAANNEPARTNAMTIERLNHIKPGQNAWTADLPEHLRINTKTTISSMYRRLDPNKPSYTVTGSGGGGYRVYHWSEPRPLTNRERARLQSFPDDFTFCGGRESVRKQIGMAVPPAGAQAIFEAALRSFAGIDYPSVEPNMARIRPGSSAMAA